MIFFTFSDFFCKNLLGHLLFYIHCYYNLKTISKAKESLCDPKERKMYDDWRHAGLAISYGQWRALKDSVKPSMHWATPRTSGRMLDTEDDDLKEEDKELLNEPEDDQFYHPIPYNQIPFRMATPPFEEWVANPSSSEVAQAADVANDVAKSTGQQGDQVSIRRRQFAVRRQSTIGAMVMTERWEDGDIRRRFRNYEI